MKIMTFNTQHCKNFITGKIDFQVMADVISAHAPDVVGLKREDSARPHKRNVAFEEGAVGKTALGVPRLRPGIAEVQINPRE